MITFNSSIDNFVLEELTVSTTASLKNVLDICRRYIFSSIEPVVKNLKLRISTNTALTNKLITAVVLSYF